METKRLILAVALSVVIFVGWNWLSLQMGWIVPAPPAETQSALNATTSPAPAAVATAPAEAAATAPAFEPSLGKEVVVDTPLYRAVFFSQGGTLREFSLKQYQKNITSSDNVVLVDPKIAFKTPMGLMLAGMNTATQGQWSFSGSDLSLQKGETGKLQFTCVLDGMTAVREYTFSAANYVIDEKLTVQSERQRELKLAFTMAAAPLAADSAPSILDTLKYAVFGGEAPKAGESQYNPTRMAWLQDNSFKEETSHGTLAEGKKVIGNVAWGAVLNNYFLCAVSMKPEQDSTVFNTFETGVFQSILGRPDLVVEAGSTNTYEAEYYLGPKVAGMLESAPNNLAKALDYGWFTVIAKPLLLLLEFLYGISGNYGIAIILMTIVIKIVFWPLSQKSYKSMEEMKRLQPMITEIREKYADDKEAMNKEIMQIYRQHKVNPAGGCFPILIQIPVFFGLYQALLNSIELRHSAFIDTLPFTDLPWLIDLSAPDPYCITPLIMGASMFLQQKMAPPMGDPTQAKIMLFMPIIFTFLFLNFPSGLVVYWLVNNIISIAQQWMQRSSKKKAAAA